jgi:uncharacterized membrane protein YukC
MAEDRIEVVARAFYGVQDSTPGWEQEPERLKKRFRSLAQAAIAAFDQQRGMEPYRGDQLRRMVDRDQQS